jgi:signal transduction histidine kinase
MHLDIPTLGLNLLLVYLGNAVLAALMAWAGRSFPGAWLWVTAQTMLVVGALFMFLRPLVPLPLSIVIGNSTYAAAAVVFAHAIWAFRFHRPFPWWLYVFVVVMVATFAGAADQEFYIRAKLYSAWSCLGATFAAVLLIWNVEQRFRIANLVTALPFFAVGVASAIRFFLNDNQAVAGDFYNQSGANALYLIGSVMVSTFTLFGYFMMAGVRAEQVVQQKDEEIQRRNRRLVESTRTKDLFFSVIAHDLRGPIGGAARYVRKHLLGKMTGLEPKYAEVETVAAALEKTHEFLEKLLWWSRAQGADWAPERLPVELGPLFEHAVVLVRSAAELKEITVDIAPPPYPLPVADPESVQLIVNNLLANAVKFSLPGRRVTLSADEGAGRCLIHVRDEGVGMDQATLDRLFRIEDKLSTHGTSGERGSGMGLILSQSLAERNLGGIEMESAPGLGTTATLWLPTAPSPSLEHP